MVVVPAAVCDRHGPRPVQEGVARGGAIEHLENTLPASPGAFFLEHAGVAVIDGPECGAPGVGHLRLNLATPAPVLTTIVERMAAAVAGRGGARREGAASPLA